MAFDMRPHSAPRSIPFGYQGNQMAATPTPTYRTRGVPLNYQPAGRAVTATNPHFTGPTGIYAPTPGNSSQNGRISNANDINSQYKQYLGRFALPDEINARSGRDFTTNLNEIRNSTEAMNLVDVGFNPDNKNPFTGETGIQGLYNPVGSNGYGYAKGGVIPEPVVGRGVVSGKRYSFGENGPEKVSPATHPYRAPSRAGSYASGGTIGLPAADSFNQSASPLPPGYGGSSGLSGGSPPPVDKELGSPASASSLQSLLMAHKKFGKHLKGLQGAAGAMQLPSKTPGHMSAALAKAFGGR